MAYISTPGFFCFLGGSQRAKWGGEVCTKLNTSLVSSREINMLALMGQLAPIEPPVAQRKATSFVFRGEKHTHTHIGGGNGNWAYSPSCSKWSIQWEVELHPKHQPKGFDEPKNHMGIARQNIPDSFRWIRFSFWFPQTPTWDSRILGGFRRPNRHASHPAADPGPCCCPRHSWCPPRSPPAGNRGDTLWRGSLVLTSYTQVVLQPTSFFGSSKPFG